MALPDTRTRYIILRHVGRSLRSEVPERVYMLKHAGGGFNHPNVILPSLIRDYVGYKAIRYVGIRAVQLGI